MTTASNPNLPAALIVAHGSPSDPDVQEAAIATLAGKVSAHMPGWRIEGVTLAAKGRLDERVSALGAPVLYPFFMARGWFTGQVLAKKARGYGVQMLDPFGTEPDLIDAAEAALRSELRSQGWDTGDTALLVAAHGSAVSRSSADSAHDFTRALQAKMRFRTSRTGFIEEPPFLKDQAQGLGQAICLPFFVQRSSHIEQDVPLSLEAAGFDGPVLPPLIEWPETPTLIAQGIARQAAVSGAG